MAILPIAAMQPTGSLFCPHLTDRILACAEKHGVPIVKNCFNGENSFADRLATGRPSERDSRPCDGAFADVECSQHRSPFMVFANRLRLERAKELRGLRGKVRAGRAQRLSLREEIKHHFKGQEAPVPPQEIVAGLGHVDAARIFAIASAHLDSCAFCHQVHELMRGGEFWKPPGPSRGFAAANDDDGEMEEAIGPSEADCVIVVQDVASHATQFLIGLCNQSMWKLAVILSQFGVMPFQPNQTALHGTKPSGSLSGEPTWNVAMVITLPRQESLDLKRIVSILRAATGTEDVRQQLLRHNDVFASATVYLNRGMLALRTPEPFVGERKCPDPIRVLSPVCT